MELSVAKLKGSLVKVNLSLKSNKLSRILSQNVINSEDIDEVLEILCKSLYENPSHALSIKDNFGYLLLPIVSKFLNLPENGFVDYQNKSIALSILAKNNHQIMRSAIEFFESRNKPPFVQASRSDHIAKKAKYASQNDLDVVQMCLRFLKIDLETYRRLWNWKDFIDCYTNQGCDLQKYICNQIVSLLFGVSNDQVIDMNKKIPMEVIVDSEINDFQSAEKDEIFKDDEKVEWKLESDTIACIEGIYLPLFEKSVSEFYNDKMDIVRVESTRVNLRSLAMGISSGKAICLSGPVGSGKTCLVEYMAKKVGRISPKMEDFCKFIEEQREFAARGVNGNKRKLETKVNSIASAPANGFVRIQLGDQTDSKVLLGQYRCTDVPGEFVWQPGVLTQAVMNGYWLLLEDIDSATQDVCTVLTNLLENNFLRVPGFRECLKITSGFQLFVTLRTHKSSMTSSNSAYSLLEKYLYTINMIPLSRSELSEIICENYPKLATISPRIVDVFLIFSSGCHTVDNEFDVASVKQNGDHLPQFHNISTATLPNSGRTVSTRDLLKLCKRSSLTFQVTSVECAYLVFQNCVDLFCSYLPAGQAKTDLIVNIGARLGIIETRCVHISNEFKPIPRMTSDELTIGRARLSRNSEVSEKRVKMTDRNEKPPTFSFTRVSSCVLERISVCVQQNEPILLVGETGVGKTSSVQYLAYQTSHKLVVVNMNNQSDVSDLIGGFKPVDMSFIITPLRNEFENLFARAFDLMKNEKFLGHVAGCFNSQNYAVLLKLMLKVISNVNVMNKDVSDSDLKRWKILEKTLKKLEKQLKTSASLSFAFIPGSLVNCIRNGDWVLLDEINLASTETLECLSTILEPDGSVILLERGDFVPVKRHPDFRIFACMNPSTDVGKKDLPTGIRNRFTEFFVDELTVENDLLILVGDYLNNTGIEKSRIHKAVQLYQDLRSLSQLELNDGLGNKPVFSLRTLCRALRICAKNLCGSIERNIYESFCLSFLTQLDAQSHDNVLTKIQKYLVSDAKKILSQQIPKPAGNQLNFEGYWIEVGEKEPQECKEYILTGSVQKNLKDLARIISIGKLPILLQGPTSAGKTSLIEFIAKKSGNHCLRINNHEHTDLQEYIGTYVADLTGKLVFQEGVLVKAMRNGYWIILDELNLAPSDILEALNRVLDDNRELYIPETQIVVKAHPNFMLFATQNPPGLYGGRKTLSRAFKNRFIELHFCEIPKNELEIILEKRCQIPMSYAQKMVKTMTALQINRRTTTKNNFTLRDLFRWGNRYTFADSSLLEDRNYDWNQHLVDEGFLVLSAKVRNQVETEIIQETLHKNFAKKIDVENLFSLNEKTSMVTKSILESLMKYTGTQNVVWTFQMRRMAILVSKSLQFNEPVLLVGPTGCGKTTVCQILAELRSKNLRILNCHMHTEGADFLGGLRPHREASADKTQLFEWSDGPLVLSMIEGNFFLADEISLAEDSVLERLNCVLEPDRTLLLAEKGGGADENILDTSKTSEFIVKASEGFQFFATMNPGGDFGKKELSPALRNRFTEIWCTAIYSDEDLTKISTNAMSLEWKTESIEIEKIAKVVVKTVGVLKKNVEKLNFSIRDVLAWINYITRNYTPSDSILSLNEAFFFGAHTIFLDALEMLPYENFNKIIGIKQKVITEMEKSIREILDEKVNFYQIKSIDETLVEMNDLKFGIHPFYLEVNSSAANSASYFSFSAPTTKNNLFRVLSALSLKKAILLEGPPGVGKSSLIENIANTIGYNIVRINLCEHTDLADLFGTDLPAESSIFESDTEVKLGAFVWRDGPLLAALKSPNTWILLDELNLAPQSVLEGLNAILDHRGEVYIPELNKTFKLGQQTRIFATQNPLRQGGGRKGLPQSFLNRFTKVYLRKLEKIDLLHVISHNFQSLEDVQMLKDYRLLERMVEFSEKVEHGITNLEFGYKGGPFEANLRDILRWCELISNPKTGCNDTESLDKFLLILYEKMKLVYCQRMRAESDINSVLRIYADIFEVNVDEFEKESKEISLYWNDKNVFLNDIQLNRNVSSAKDHHAIILSSQKEELKHVAECVLMEKPIILCGPSDCGKTKIINTFCTIFNNELQLDTIDDSVTGSFQQFDLNRVLEEMWEKIEKIAFEKMAMGKNLRLFELWHEHEMISDNFENNEKETEIEYFIKRLNSIVAILENLKHVCDLMKSMEIDKMLHEIQLWKKFLQNSSSSTLNTGGHFEWVDSMIVKSIKFGHFICLEHINLVSSAILDRLNPVLEPNGTLMISEKGVTTNNEPETISKHKDFRIFLTMDPKHGEVSRAMRNRCIELSIPHQNYTEDDLRKLIYIQGVHDMYLIKAIVDIHKNLQSLSDFTTFGVSHVMKMAFLVAQNKTVGIEDKKCLSMSAMEVYVRSSNLDLMGFGLPYYRTKLKEKINEVVEKLKYFENMVNYENLIINAADLSTMKMIKLQAEPLIAIMRCKSDGDVNRVMSDLHTKLGDFDIKSTDEVSKYLLTFLYMMSSLEDVDSRWIYLQKMLPFLKIINDNLHRVVKNQKSDKYSPSLPWNFNLFPRLRPYINKQLSTEVFKTNLSLILEMTLREVTTMKSTKISDIDAISYSKAVQANNIADTIDNRMLTKLYRLLNTFKAFVKSSLENLDIDEENYKKILLAFMWFNRVLEVAKQKLFNRNNLRDEVIDELNLHFKWLAKYCVDLLGHSQNDEEFMKIFNDIQNFILSHHHSLQLYKKIYVKNFTSFLPFYDESQTLKHQQLRSITNLMKFDSDNFEHYQKLLTLMTSTSYKDFRKIFYNNQNSHDCIHAFKQSFNNEMVEIFGELECENEKVYDISEKIKEYEEFLQHEEMTINFKNEKFDIEIIPILEFFIIKSLQPSTQDSITNIDYALNIPSIGAESLVILKLLSSPQFEKIQKIASSEVASKDFKNLYKSLTMAMEYNIQKMVHNSMLVKNNELCRILDDEEKFKEMENSQYFINGPLLTCNIVQCLLQRGVIRGTGLGEVDQWKFMLQKLRNIMWSNAELSSSKKFDFLRNECKKNQAKSQDLIEKIEIVKEKCLTKENKNLDDLNKDFWTLIHTLQEKNQNLEENWLDNFATSSLIASIELNLLSYFPLIDPVKKNSLKTKYIQQDIDHLEKLLLAYKFMSIILDYENLGNSDKKLLIDEIKILEEKLSKNVRKVALRPEVCVYSSMVKDVNHFLISFCHPNHLLSIIKTVESVVKTKSKNKSQLCEFMSKLDLWISNADKFLNHTLRNYQIYYRDFIAPIECSVTSLKNGFMGLRCLLQMRNESIVMQSNEIWDCNENGELLDAMSGLINFPSEITSLKSNKHLLLTIETLPEEADVFFTLVKSQIKQIENTTSSVDGNMSLELFLKFDEILNICNQVWQKQEETRRKKQIEEDSLYVTKTKCLEDDDETIKQREIEEIFPETTNDFFEYSRKDTLEQVKVVEKKKKFIDTITDDDYKLIGDFFINLMSEKSSAKDYLAVYSEKVKVFYALFDKFSSCLNGSLDDIAYRGMSLLIGLCQENYDELQLKDLNAIQDTHNFYKDSSITEAIKCVEVMKKLEERVNKELEQWPEHAVLNDILIIINRIRNFASTSPLVRFNVGMQILRQKVNDWNQVAHRLNNFKDIECEIAGFIQSWMQMELQCWRESLNQTFEAARGKAYRYWFFLYNLVHEYVLENEQEKESSLVDIKQVEKRFGEDEFLEEKPKGKISMTAVTNVLKQFIESSNFAEFHLRMNLLKAFEKYIEKLPEKSTKAKQLSSVLHNLHDYFSQFSTKVQEQIDFVRRPIEDKLRKFVKINSFNKDLSYFSTESNIKQVHRNLHKHLKEFDVEIKKKILDLFIYRDSGSELDGETNGTKSFLNLEAFLISIDVPQLDVQFAQDLPKFTKKSRDIVKKSLSNAHYPSLIETLQEMISAELENCNHLRCLKVDENLPRSKQKSQAKSFLNQKRKALSDFFKTMSSLGMNYRSGLLTTSLNSEFVDLKITPFSYSQLNLSNDDGKADLYFNKSIFKMKLLTNILLAPHANLDYNFLERIKGFAIDLYSLVQSQRENLSENVNNSFDLRKFIQDFENVMKCGKNEIIFSKENRKAEIVKSSFIKASETLEQLKLLMKCAPESDTSNEHKAIVSTQTVFYQKSQTYRDIMTITNELLNDLKINFKSESRFVINGSEMVNNLSKVTKKIHELKECFAVGDEYSVYGLPLCELYESLNRNINEINSLETPANESTNLEDDFGKLTHSILLVIQNIYKEYREKEATSEEEPQNQLKEKLHLKLISDLKVLSLPQINQTLARISDKIYNFCDESSINMLTSIHPLLKQFKLLTDFFVIQQFNAHRLSTKMLSIMLSVFLELSKNGFCIPENLLSDEEQKEELDKKPGEGFGFEDGQGEKDVSDKLESEDQLDEAKRPEDYKKGDQEENKDCKEEKGIEMSDNFEGKMHDLPEDGSDNESDPENDKEEMDKEMGDTGEKSEKLDDQIWGSDDENEPEESDMKDETGKGSGDKDEQHNDLAAEGDDTETQNNEDALDAASNMDEKKEKKQQKKDIDNMNDEGEAEDQLNPYHNDLEEPPEPEDLNLDDEFNLDNQENDKDQQNEENPFDIDKIKDGMEVDEDNPEDTQENAEEQQKKEEATQDSSDDENGTEQPDLDNPENVEEDPNAETSQEPVPQPDAINPDDEDVKDDSKTQETPSDYSESKDKQSKEQNIQSMPNQKEKSSHDQVQMENNPEDPNQQQETEIDDQDTGEDREGVGQAENQESKSGHQGIADTKETQSRRNRDQNQMNQKRKKGNTNEERTLGDVDNMENKFLKTVEKLNREQNDVSDDEGKNDETDEYQHVKDAKKSDKTTLDNATEEQSKKIQHEENSKTNEEESHDDLMDVDKEDPEMLDEKPEELLSNKIDKKSDKKSTKKDDRNKERLENAEEIQIDGEDVTTFNVPRGDETTAHCQMDIVNDTTACEEQSNAEMLEIRKAVEAELIAQHVLNPEASDMEKWQEISNRMMSNARELCEQLRLILEPTKCTRLKGDYRTGRRINMKKIIPYIASQFRKDKIWLRRTKAAQRDYKITIAVDDSKSMDHNNSKELTLQAISLVSQALTLLESGKLSVLSFGESSKVLLKYNEQFNGPKLFKSLNFSQNKTRIAELLDFARVMNQDGSSDGFFEHLLIILSDGRNIFSEGEKKVRNAVKMARLQRVFIIYIIIDNPTNKDSILDIRTVMPFNLKDKTTTIIPYMNQFPFPYYVIVRDLNQLPLVLSDGLRQWFELVNSE